MQRVPWRRLAAVLALGVCTLAGAGAAPAAEDNAYTVHPLVSNQPALAPTPDGPLVNGWGLTAGPQTPWWVSDNGSDQTTLYNGNTGAPVGLVVAVAGAPTGAVFNGSTSDFLVTDGTASGAARFIFATEDGTIRGWNPGVPPPPTSHATEIGADRSDVGASYKGLAIATTADGPHLYAADFHNARVDVFAGDWSLVTEPGAFVDPAVPAGYAPFGIQAIGSRIFVTYAKQDAEAADEVAGQGLGFVDAYDTAGHLLARVAQHGQLDAPWGLAWAPPGFGRFGGDLLVGNFGDGQINAYEELPSGQFVHRGELRSSDGGKLTIDGLWALEFGNGFAAGPTDTLFFTAGPNDEMDGLFGSITAG